MATGQGTRPLANQVAKTVVDSAPVVKIVCVCLTVLYLVGLAPGVSVKNLAISAGTFLPQFKIWTALTAGFYEQHLVYVLLDFVALLSSSATLQPLWGGEEFIRFIVLVQVLTSIAVILVYFFIYVLIRKEAYLFTTFNGMGGLVAALAVAMKQVMPDQTIMPLPLIGLSLRMRHVPFSIVASAGILAAIGLLPVSAVVGVSEGLFFGWLYLRFYQRQGAGRENVRGDQSGAFAFATFFPEVLQPLVSPVLSTIYAVLVALRLCPKQPSIVDIDTFNSTNVHLLSADAQRQRELALKALNSRLKDTDEPEDWPSMDGDAEAGDADNAANVGHVEIDMSRAAESGSKPAASAS
ncbi:transmembrane protein 115-like [Sycon ciliatum]|uniref:transmembrane protein 115-like n=1 Tax=Sycon ciliatum TaxID=27933 RepID=UPI0020AA88BF|eukprot:scpid70033/ scgid14176/ Transmembrane protein 115